MTKLRIPPAYLSTFRKVLEGIPPGPDLDLAYVERRLEGLEWPARGGTFVMTAAPALVMETYPWVMVIGLMSAPHHFSKTENALECAVFDQALSTSPIDLVVFADGRTILASEPDLWLDTQDSKSYYHPDEIQGCIGNPVNLPGLGLAKRFVQAFPKSGPVQEGFRGVVLKDVDAAMQGVRDGMN